MQRIQNALCKSIIQRCKANNFSKTWNPASVTDPALLSRITRFSRRARTIQQHDRSSTQKQSDASFVQQSHCTFVMPRANTALQLPRSVSHRRARPRHHGNITQSDTWPYNPYKTKKALICDSTTNEASSSNTAHCYHAFQIWNFRFYLYFSPLKHINRYCNMQTFSQRLTTKERALTFANAT